MTRPDDQLASRYRMLLRAYPRSYRAGRGDEILGTLLDAAHPGQRWPNRRDAASMIIGGLRARAGSRPTSVRAVLADAFYLAVFAWVAAAIAKTTGIFIVIMREGGWAGPWVLVSYALPFGLCLATLVALVWRGYVVAVAALVAAMALGWGVHQPLPFGPLPKMSDIGLELSVPVLMTIVALAWWRHRPTVRWPVTLAAVLLVMPYEALMVSDVLPGNFIILGSEWGSWALVLLPPTIAALLVVVEPRLTLAVAGHSTLVYLGSVWTSVVSGDPYYLYIQPALAAPVFLVAAVGLLVARRQTRI
jgi:hypothetical protein